MMQKKNQPKTILFKQKEANSSSVPTTYVKHCKQQQDLCVVKPKTPNIGLNRCCCSLTTTRSCTYI